MGLIPRAIFRPKIPFNYSLGLSSMPTTLLPSIYQPVDVVFVSVYSVEESARRVSALCMPDTANSLASRWLVGTATGSFVQLTWRVRGSKPSGMQFKGTLDQVSNSVVLSGTFSLTWLEQAFISIWFGLLSVVFGACLYDGVFHEGKNVLGGAVVTGCLLTLGVWASRVKGAESKDDIAWVSAALREALSS